MKQRLLFTLNRLCLIGFLLLSVIAVTAQNIAGEKMIISGKIMDENRQPIPSVTVTDISGSAATISDEEGMYSINIPIGDSLRFSHIGYETQTIKPNINEELDVVMTGV